MSNGDQLDANSRYTTLELLLYQLRTFSVGSHQERLALLMGFFHFNDCILKFEFNELYNSPYNVHSAIDIIVEQDHVILGQMLGRLFWF